MIDGWQMGECTAVCKQFVEGKFEERLMELQRLVEGCDYNGFSHISKRKSRNVTTGFEMNEAFMILKRNKGGTSECRRVQRLT